MKKEVKKEKANHHTKNRSNAVGQHDVDQPELWTGLIL